MPRGNEYIAPSVLDCLKRRGERIVHIGLTVDRKADVTVEQISRPAPMKSLTKQEAWDLWCGRSKPYVMNPEYSPFMEFCERLRATGLQVE